MSTKFLKVKIKSLAAEARIIRHEERKSRGQLRNDLAAHRKGIVRREARSSQLAYGYLRGRPYRKLEPTCHRQPDWTAVERMVKKYGRLQQPIEEWKDEQEKQSVRSAAA